MSAEIELRTLEPAARLAALWNRREIILGLLREIERQIARLENTDMRQGELWIEEEEKLVRLAGGSS